jgi:hypothetical protein
MKNNASLNDAKQLIETARSAGFGVTTETRDWYLGTDETTTIRGERAKFGTTDWFQIFVTVSRPSARRMVRGRTSVAIRTQVSHDAANNKPGLWHARHAISEMRAALLSGHANYSG